MKRRKQILNRQHIRVAKRMAQWCAKGCHWGEGIFKEAVIAAGQAALRLNAVQLDALGHQIAATERQLAGQDEILTQTDVSYLIADRVGVDLAAVAAAMYEGRK